MWRNEVIFLLSILYLDQHKTHCYSFFRWTEVFISILKRKGYHIDYPVDWDGNDATVLVNGQTELWEFVNSMPESNHELLKDYTFLITRLFDARVKSFIKNVLMGTGKDKIPLEYYSYRVEFQARGMPHIHGVAWIQKDFLAAKGITGYLCDHPKETNEIANELLSCELPDTDNNLKAIVAEVQKHSHTKSCQKYTGRCRFGFPKLPSPKTFMTEPLEPMEDEKEKEALMKKANEVLKSAKEILDDEGCNDDMSFDEFLQMIGISQEEYLHYINITQKTRVIILKRSVKERYINNYNKEMIIAWNANMDIQLALDPFAIICYIVNYTLKDESGMTKFLMEALNASSNEDLQAKLKSLKEAYLTHRQMGASEAAYRVIPNMKLKDSNITCTFVTTGFPENRSVFYRKMAENDHEIVEDHEDSEEANQDGPVEDSVQIQGHSGKFQKSITVIERYAARPSCLESMSLAQFSIFYTAIKSPPKKVVFDNNGASEAKSSKQIFNTEDFLPHYVELRDKKLGFLRLRTFPSVLRIHSSNKKDGHEKYYSELLLFVPWRDEREEFYRDLPLECKKKYEERKEEIDLIRKIMYPGESTFDILDSEDFEFQNSNPTYDTLDGQREQENSDDVAVGASDDPKFESFGYTGNVNREETGHFETFKYKKICLPTVAELKHLCCLLVPEQLNIVRKVVGYCKDVVKASTKGDGKLKPVPIKLIVHGGAGVGKSLTIKAISLLCEKILRRKGQHPNHPRVLLCAPTGRAASLINGITIHSAFSFNFGPEFKGLKGKKLAEFRENLKHLKLLIIDEMSLLGADMLYKIHKRLSLEIFQNEEPFGGISVLLVGDLLQLPPVNGAFIFKSPLNKHFASFHKVCPLWKEFEPMILKHNHRQGEGGKWADALNRFREGIVTSEDEELLAGRVMSNRTSDPNSMLLCYKNRIANDHNENMLNAIESPLISVQASKEQPRGCKATIQPHGTIDNTRFMNLLTIKMGARCCIIYNINTIDSLVNGATGTIVGLEFNTKQGLECIIVQFDNESWGEEQRLNYPEISEKYKNVNGTPIFKYECEYEKRTNRGFVQYAKTKLRQFPLQINYASTAHRIQGSTVKAGSKVEIHWSSEFKFKNNAGMAYVCLGRSEKLDDIYITGEFDVEGIHCSPDALDETKRLQKVFDEQVLKQEEQRSLFWKICFLNVRSLRSKQKEVSNDNYLMDSDIFSLGETHLIPGETIAFEKFSEHFASSGQYRGTAVYTKMALCNQPCSVVSQNYSAIQVKTIAFDLIFMYLSKDFDHDSLFRNVDNWIEKDKPTAVIGDVNWDFSRDTRMKKSMKVRGFSQQIQKATYDDGTLIDHVYVNEPMIDQGIFTEQEAAYFTDHDIVTLFIAKK